MIYNKRIVDERVEELNQIFGKIKGSEIENENINNELEALKIAKEERIREINEKKEEELAKLEEKNINNLEKLEEGIKINFKKSLETLEGIRESIDNIEISMDESFEHLKDNADRKRAYVEPKNINEAVTKLKCLYEEIVHNKSERDKKNEGASRFTSLIHDKLIEMKDKLQFRQKFAIILFIGFLIYKIVVGFMEKDTTTQIVYGVFIILVVTVTLLLRHKFKTKSVFGNVNRVYEIYNLIEYLDKKYKLEKLNLSVQERDKIRKAKEIAENMYTKSIDELNKRYASEIELLEEEYENKITLLEFQEGFDLVDFDEDIEIVENNEIPLLANTIIKDRRIGLYYNMRSIIINNRIISSISEKIMQNLAQEIVRKEELGLVKIKIVDVVGLGRKFRDIIKLKGTGLDILDKKIYITNEEISNMLDGCIQKISSRLQNILAYKYKNIYEYNEENDKKLDYEFIFIQDMDKIKDEKIYQKINTIIQHGRDCGIIIIASGTNLETIIDEDVDIIEVVEGGGIFARRYNGVDVEYPLECIDKEIYMSKIDEIYKKASAIGNKSINFLDMIPSDDEIWAGDTSNLLDVVIGVKDDGGPQNVKLGGTGINHHILLGGNTGSGKTSFIHTLIISSCLKYSPELLELILIDFKQGVEFQIYADYKLPHAKFLGLESDREYVLNILLYLNKEMTRRADLCKDLGVADLTAYNNHPNQIKNPKNKLKRIVIIIDEFQEMLRGQDNIEMSIRELLDIITRIGRSFGIHLILSSQSITGIPGGLGGIENRLGTRIALRCNEEDSRAILSNNNPAAADLDRIGQGIFNDNQGRLSANNKFIFGYIDDELKDKLLNKIRDKAEEIGYKTETQIFYKSQLRHIDEVEWFENIDSILDKSFKTNILLGDSSSLTKSYVDITLTRQSGENLLIIVKDKKSNSRIVNTLTKTLKYYITRAGEIVENSVEGLDLSELYSEEDDNLKAKIIKVDAEKITSSESSLEDGIEYKVFGVKEADIIIENIYEIIQERREEQDIRKLYPIYFIINNAQRIRSIQEDEYISETTRLMTEILKEGPYVGVHTITILDTYRSLERIRAKVMNESCHRLVGRMNDIDSSYVINDKSAGLLDTDNELIYYNDTSSVYEKVRLLRH